MANIRWLPGALGDLKRLHAFIEPHSHVAASRAIDTFIAAAEALRDFPEKGRPWSSRTNYRELLVKFGSRGYMLRYRYLDDQVFIIRRWHALEERSQ